MDFKGHSLSVSDVVAIKRDGEITAHYVDSYGYTELPEFFSSEGENHKAGKRNRITGKQPAGTTKG
ncbi:YodL domain-containing protein [Sporofaciens musculi]|uniref:YodL domain-containing protein n=1 Tax=Sporofaciens musculi TaxID=2681861 RepID=UPI002AC34B84|nr:YodL domain-containing protein [Sporofaciens musculi]